MAHEGNETVLKIPSGQTDMQRPSPFLPMEQPLFSKSFPECKKSTISVQKHNHRPENCCLHFLWPHDEISSLISKPQPGDFRTLALL
jgi:hypothetical protein